MSNQETLPYSERSILVLGGAGANSIGRAAVDHFHELNTRAIYIGTTQEVNFDRVKKDYEEKDLPTDNLHPFVADVRDKASLLRATREIKSLGLGLTDVVYSHAGGMDGFLPQLLNQYLRPIRIKMRGASSLYRLDDAIQAEVQAMMVPMYEQIKIWREEAIPHGIAINYEGTFNAREVLRDEFSNGFTGVFINSTWGHLSSTPGVEIPLLYGPVDVSKAKVRDEVREKAELFYEEKTPMAMLIASLVRRTRVGKMFQDFLMSLSQPEQAAAIRSTAVDPEDVVGGIRMIIESNPNTWPNHQMELFVTGERGQPKYNDHLEMSAMYSIPYPY